MDWGPQGIPFEREQNGGGAHRKEREPSEDIGVCGVKVVHEAFELEYGKGVFPGWDFKVKKSEMRICRRLGLLKNVKEDIVSPSDFIPWAGLQGKGSLANGKAKNLI